ncbi:MAG: hypothetical protein H6733_11825 [Alphaproteobacteria bacterium]|nr:hypothetical protein [Alphaproteobacteria bacterium]
MIVVAHRRNTVAELAATPPELGVEVDVRSFGDRLVVVHDPFVDGVPFETWLRGYRHALLVVNTKEEGLVEHVLPVLRAHGVERFFFLGPPVPELLPFAAHGERRFSVRVSEVHHPGTALALADRVDWVWLDGFAGFPVDAATARALHDAGLAVCLVSPELYGRDPDEVDAYAAAARATGVPFAAVCTRQVARWQRLTG